MPRLLTRGSSDSFSCFCCRRGTSGFVQKALDMRTGQPVAVKLVPRGPGAQSFDAQHLTRELLNHRMVRELVAVFVEADAHN
jgi:hypothetical protein